MGAGAPTSKSTTADDMGSNRANSITLAATTANLPPISNRAPARQYLRQEPGAGGVGQPTFLPRQNGNYGHVSTNNLFSRADPVIGCIPKLIFKNNRFNALFTPQITMIE